MSTDPWGASTPPKHFIPCHSCERATNATEMGTVFIEDSRVGLAGRVILARCDTCGDALLLAQSDEDPEPSRIWPEGRRALNPAVPASLRAEHQEAQTCLEARAYTATVVMVRRTLEGVCAEFGVKRGPLAAGLAELERKGLLDGRLVEWSQALRVLGNEGAHFTGNRVSREDAKDALAFCEALLDYTYVLTAKFEEFRARRAPKPADPPDGTAG